MGLGTWLFGKEGLYINGKRTGTTGKIADFLDGNWFSDSTKAKNAAMTERYENMSDRELIRVFESYKDRHETYKLEFLAAAKILKDRGIVDEHLNIIG